MTSQQELTHLVLYQTNPDNPDAVQQIIDNATTNLANIPGVQHFHVGPKHDNGRAVGAGFDYDVAFSVTLRSKNDLATYMEHPNHLRFVEFVLNGWQLADTIEKTVERRRAEFIDNVLHASLEEKREWAIDSEVPTLERVWKAEQVYDFGV